MSRFAIRSVLLPTAWVIPWWLQTMPPFNRLVYVKRTYQNDYTSNTRVIVVLRKRSPETKLNNRECRDVVYAGTTWQSICLYLKTFLCRGFWKEFIRKAKTVFEMK